MKKIVLLLAFFVAHYAFAKNLPAASMAYTTPKNEICIDAPTAIDSNTTVASDISLVTVYLNGAQIERTTEVLVSEGTTTFIIDNLSNTIDENSIQVSGLKDATILSINYGIDHLTKHKNTEAVEALQKEKKTIEFNIKKLNNLITGLHKEEEVINLNQKLGSTTQEISLEKIKALATYYRERVTAIKNEILDAELNRSELQQQKQDLSKQLTELNITEEKSTGKITLKIHSDIRTPLQLNVSYNVSNAGWYPLYDLKAKAINTPLDLSYKAHIYQNTGSAWDDVKLVISTGDPNTNNLKPTVTSKYLNFVTNYYRAKQRKTKTYNYKYNPRIKKVTGIVQEDGGALPGATVNVKGTNISTQTDFDGQYTIEVPRGKALVYSYIGYLEEEIPIYASTMNVTLEQDESLLEEVVVTAYGIKKEKKALGYAVSEVSSDDITTLEDMSRVLSGKAAGVQVTGTGDFKTDGITTTRFEIKKKYSIPSDGDITVIEVDAFEIPATYEYFAAPILNENVFLTASIKEWARYSLLPGEANIYFEGSFSGKTFIDPLATTEELTVSLGVDPGVTVKREQLDNIKATSFIGSQRIIDNSYSIEIKNNKTTAIDLKLVDRIPKSQNKEIKVDDVETGDADYKTKTGLLEWKLNIAPNDSQEKSFSYELRFPKTKRINL